MYLFRTITKCSYHCINRYENSDLNLGKCVKSIEENCNAPYFEMYRNTCFHMCFMIILFIHYLLFIINVSFQF